MKKKRDQSIKSPHIQSAAHDDRSRHLGKIILIISFFSPQIFTVYFVFGRYDGELRQLSSAAFLYGGAGII